MKYVRTAALALALTCALTACQKPPAPTPAPTLAPTTAPTPTPGLEGLRWGENYDIDDIDPQTLPTQFVSADTLLTYTPTGEPSFYLLAALPDEGVFLYGLDGFENLTGDGKTGILLRWNNTLTFFEQPYLTSENPALPELWWGDFDYDGQEELAVKYLLSNQAGFTQFELHMYETANSTWTDHVFAPEAYTKLLEESISYRYDAAQRVVTAFAGAASADLYLSDHDPAPIPSSQHPLVFADEVFFRYQGGTFTGVFSVSVQLEGTTEPISFALVTAEVAYDGQSFSLSNFRPQGVGGV